LTTNQTNYSLTTAVADQRCDLMGGNKRAKVKTGWRIHSQPLFKKEITLKSHCNLFT
jgi:hypothetical protein